MEALKDNNLILLGTITFIGIIALIGFFITKTKGFGPFNTSAFLILLVLIITSLLYTSCKLDGQTMGNILFAIIGFSGGLFTHINAKEKKEKKEKNDENDESKD
jgi:hypothetical protein